MTLCQADRVAARVFRPSVRFENGDSGDLLAALARGV